MNTLSGKKSVRSSFASATGGYIAATTTPPEHGDASLRALRERRAANDAGRR